MMKLFFMLTKRMTGCLLILASFNAYTQTVERQVVASAGAVLTSGIEISCTIGEAVITPLTTPNLLLTQGFQQPYFVAITSGNLFPWLVLYPNPTGGDAIARFILGQPDRITISVYNTIGQEMMKESIAYTQGEMQYILPASRLLPGIYFISFRLGDGKPVVTKKLIRLDH
jgi:Secretion system C-terminal sorting domain